MNPFIDILKADVLSPEQATQLFVPDASPIWYELQRPINHIVVGPRGAGKTIALKQLDQKITSSPDGASFFGIYLQISRICTMFSSIFDHARTNRDEVLSSSFMRMFSDYTWLEIVRELIEFLESLGHKPTPATIEAAFGIKAQSLADAKASRAELTEAIEQAIDEWSIRPDDFSWTTRFNLVESLDRCVAFFRKIVSELDQNRPCLYLLLDESSPIPLECQEILNGLLIRGRSFCVKLAIRPFEWDTLTTASGRPIEIDTDVWPLQLRYPLDEDYAVQMTKVLSRVLSTRLDEQEHTNSVQALNRMFPRDDSFPCSGFDSIALASSGNPQNILQICSYVFSSASFQANTGFDPEIQDRVVRAWSRDYEERNPYLDSRSFCRALLRRACKETTVSIGFTVSDQGKDLFSADYVRAPFGRLIQSGFSGGFLRPIDFEQARSLFEVPASFCVSRGMLPAVNLSLDLSLHPLNEIDNTFIRANTRERPRHRQESEPPKEMTAFLSTSFSSAIKRQRADIKQHLGRLSVKCEDVEDRINSQFLFSAIVEKIRASDFVILDATELRPYTMLEIGICAGVPRKPKDVVCVINEDSIQAIRDLPHYIQVLPVLTFSYDSGHLSELAAKIVSRAQDLREQKSEFSQVAITKASLRPPRRKKSVYLSLPPSSVRVRTISKIRTALESAGWNVFTEEDGESYCANDLQVSAYCAHLTRIGIIDTTGNDHIDLLQCYRLGLFLGKRAPWRVLHVNQGNKDKLAFDPFASVPNLEMKRWNSIDDLEQLVMEFLGL